MALVIGLLLILPSATAAQKQPPTLTVTTLISGLSIPWDLDFTPDGTMLFTERAGGIKVRLAGGTVQQVTADLSDVAAFGEAGLMALVIDPGFSSNRKFYTCQATTSTVVEVVAWTINNTYSEATRINDPLVGGIPAAGRHSGCRLRFGPQGSLWIATGDAATGTIPQDKSSLGGKVLRVQASSGAGAAGNPFADYPLIYTYGHRNIQGLAVRPGTSQMWIVEHGPDFDDEINLLTAGGNYGWDPVPGYDESVPMTDLTKFPAAIEARWSSGVSTLATSGGIFLSGTDWGKWNGWLAVASLKDQTLRFFHFASDGTFIEQVNVPEMNGIYGRLRTPMLGPDGSLYVTTSNGANDKILKITPGFSNTPRGSDGGGGNGGGSGGGGSGGSGGGSGGGSVSRDLHGNTPTRATRVRLGRAAPWASVTPGQLNPATDVDYFTLDVPQAGLLVVETTGSTDTRGTVWQAEEELATDDNSGARRNFRLSVRVEAGAVVMAVAGSGRRTGRYTLQTRLLVGYLENPGAESFQSGIGVISGWVCAAEEVEIELNGTRQAAAYGTERLDTAEVCGDTDNGFGLLFNWNLLGEGEHEVVAFVDGVELGRATVTVTTLGAEFLRDLTGTCEVEDFPTVGETVTLEWQQSQQNFVLLDGEEPRGANRAGRAGVGYLENPGPNTFQSGISVISGWVCEGDAVEIQIGDLGRQVAAYGTERLDTREVCGDTDNGFGLLFNWNLLGEGEHEVVAYVNSEELSRTTVRVTTLGEEFVRGVAGECVVEDFPDLDQTVTLEWQQNSQNFVIVAVE